MLLAEQVVHEQSDTAAIAFGDDDESFVQCASARLDTEQFVQTDDGQIIAAEREDLVASGQAADARLFQSHGLDDGDERDDVGFAANRDRLAIDDGEGEGQCDDEARALTAIATQLDFSTELLHVTAYDVHTDTTAGQVGGLLRGGEAR